MKPIIAALLVGISSGIGRAQMIDFEGVDDSTPVTVQYRSLGVTFQHASALSAGVSLNEIEFPPHSGSNVVFDDGGFLSGLFSTPVLSFSGFFTYETSLRLSALDDQGNELAFAVSHFSSNSVSSGRSPNEFLEVSSSSPIFGFTLSGSPTGGSFVLDDFQFTPSAVPEPSTAFAGALVGVVALFSGVRRRLKRIRQKRLLTSATDSFASATTERARV